MKKYIQVLILMCGVLGWNLSKAQSTIVSINGEGNWSDPTMWIGGVVPGGNDSVVVAHGATIYVDQSFVVRALTIGTSNAGPKSSLIINDNISLSVLGTCYLYRGRDGGFVKSITVGTRYFDFDLFEDVIGTGENAILKIGGDLTIVSNTNKESGINLIGVAQLELAGSIILPQSAGFFDASSTATVILNGDAPQQIYMGLPTAINFPNLVVDGDSVYLHSANGNNGSVSGELRVKKGVFDNSGKALSVAEDIVIEETGKFRLTGPSTISVTSATSLALYGKLFTEHAFGLSALQTPGTIIMGAETEVEFGGTATAQRAGFDSIPLFHVFPRIIFGNPNGTKLEKDLRVSNLEIKSGARFMAGEPNGTPHTISVKNTWLNNGTFDGYRGTVSFETGDLVQLQGNGVNNFGNLHVDESTVFSAPSLLGIAADLIVHSGSRFQHNEGKVVFNPSINGATTSGVGQFYDLELNRGVNFTGNDTINHELYLKTGPISSISGSLTLNLNTGYINPEGDGGLNGDLTLIKSASKKGYTAVSLPVGASVSDLKSAGFEYVFRYDDKASPYYLVPLSNATALAADGRAYACHSAESNSSNPIIRASGAYNNTRETVTVPVVSTPVNGQFTAGYTGWNLIGNPFAFDVDWDELLELSGNNAIYRGLYYQMGDNFQAYINGVPSGDYNRLGPMQGAMVYLPNPGNTPINNTFTFSKEAGLASSNILRRKAQPTNVLKLNVSNGEYSDATYVRLSSDATVGFDQDMDAYKFRNGGSVPSFFSYKDGINYSINSVPDVFGKYSMLLAFEPKVAGMYTITLSEEYTYDLPYEIYLEDKVLNVMHPIGIDQSYTFSTNLEERSGRFTLHFENDVITAMQGADYGFVRVFSQGRDVVVTGADVDEAADIRLYDVAGRMVAQYSRVDLSNKTFSFKVGAIPGVYIVNIVAGEKTRSERVVIY